MGIHPTAIIEEGAEIGEGTTIREFAIIRAGAKIGRNCVIAEFCLIEAAEIGDGTKIWDHSKVRSGAKIGNNCNIGAKVNIDTNVKIGNNCKIQNSVNMFEGLTLEDGIFVGPNVQFTNFLKPRAINVDGSKRMGGEISPTLVKTGARIGTNTTVVCGITLGEWCFIAPHACIRSNVGEYEFWAGVPAKHKGYMCHCGTLGSYQIIKSDYIRERKYDYSGYHCNVCDSIIPNSSSWDNKILN